eukprot:Gregarina_sp_Poly_1__5447@NODE_287_length_10022_cov_246_780311_g248_i0_p4_GENE_NODE_287_length_10022_cov_246_780311_g248_i0NODE_287_length_10022_cov_246_780311_g248_i0_p4_ORF_typecomplete_len337_score36_75FXMRP1_C_core/PF12235_8/1_3_NODE_287_length_10022_cov_246_780311_g248_i026103620
MKIPSRRALRHDQIFDAIIERLFPDVEAFEKERNEVMTSLSRKMAGGSQPPSVPPPSVPLEPLRSVHRRSGDGDGGRRRRAASLRARDFIRAEARGSPRETPHEGSSRPSSSSMRDDPLEIDATSEESNDEADEEAEAGDASEDASEDAESSDCGRRRRRRQLTGRRANYDLPPSPGAAVGIIEVFLICQNTNLPPSLLSLARELSKRPLRFALHQSSNDVAAFLADRLIRDALGPMDPIRLQHEISFVKEVGCFDQRGVCNRVSVLACVRVRCVAVSSSGRILAGHSRCPPAGALPNNHRKPRACSVAVPLVRKAVVLDSSRNAFIVSVHDAKTA